MAPCVFVRQRRKKSVSRRNLAGSFRDIFYDYPENNRGYVLVLCVDV